MIAAFIDALAATPSLLWLLLIARRYERGLPIGATVRATLVAVALSYVLAHVNRWFDLWKAHPNFPSGHETFAACVGAVLVSLDRRFWPYVLAILAILGYGLVRAGWHSRYEVIAGFLLGAGIAACTLQVQRARLRIN